MVQTVHRVLIVGGGFGGLAAARALRHAPVQVTLIDRRNFHLFQPLLYQVATGSLSPANIAAPLRAVLHRQANTEVLMGEVVGIDLARRTVQIEDGELAYDSLIVAAGSTHSYFGHPEWERLAPGLKTLEDATALRGKILSAFETAERLRDPVAIDAWMTFVIVGGGPTGVEMAGAVAELAHETLRHDFRHIDPRKTRIVLVEGSDRLLPPFAPGLSAIAHSGLEALRVEVINSAHVTEVEEGWVTVKGCETVFQIATHTVIWSAGVHASPLAKMLAAATGSELDRGGRVSVGTDFTLAGHPEVFVIGDMAHCAGHGGKPLPGVAPVAIQGGRYAARLIAARLARRSLPPFHYHDQGMMATVGRMKAVADLYGFRFGGPLAWFVWLFVHLMQIVQFENRVTILLHWAWHYSTRNRSARLITGDDADGLGRGTGSPAHDCHAATSHEA